jgi:hypothetical protein
VILKTTDISEIFVVTIKYSQLKQIHFAELSHSIQIVVDSKAENLETVLEEIGDSSYTQNNNKSKSAATHIIRVQLTGGSTDLDLAQKFLQEKIRNLENQVVKSHTKCSMATSLNLSQNEELLGKIEQERQLIIPAAAPLAGRPLKGGRGRAQAVSVAALQENSAPLSPNLYPWMASKTPQTTKVVPDTLVISRTSNQNDVMSDLKKGKYLS